MAMLGRVLLPRLSFENEPSRFEVPLARTLWSTPRGLMRSLAKTKVHISVVGMKVT